MSSASSDDDRPLAKANGHVSAPTVSRAEDQALDREIPNDAGERAGLSIRNGPVEDMDVDEPATNGHKRKSRTSISKPAYKDVSDSDGDEPLAKRKKPNVKPENDSDSDDAPISRGRKLPPSYKETDILESSDSETPLGVKLAKEKASIEKAAEKEAKAINAREARAKAKKAVKDESSDDDQPIAKAKRPSTGGAKRKSNGVKKEESDSDAPISKKSKATVKKEKGKPAPPAKGTKKDVKQEEDDDEHQWWNAPKRLDGTKWDTLEHNGVIFAPEYEPLPKNVKLYYEGKPITLSKEAEEVATFWVAMLATEANSTQGYTEKEVFRNNFFNDWKEYLKKYGAWDSEGNKVTIKSLEKCDFSKMLDYWVAATEAKKTKNLSKEEREAKKKEKDELEAPYAYCLWDGRKQKVGNFRVEPPGLFRGRGDHPKMGKVKTRVYAEDITINCGKDAKVPTPPPGHKWKAVQHDNKATWLAMWTENVNGSYKYVMLNAASDVKGQSDFNKFEKARELKKHIARIRKDYEKEMKDQQMADRQRATAMYLIDKLALRAGNEKDAENEAETVGCCSLKYEHISLEPPNKVTFDFLGKDSIRYHETSEVDPQVFKNLKLFKKAPKGPGDDIFDRLTTAQLNKHLNSYMPGLTAKVFRTYNASWTMQQELKKLETNKIALHGTPVQKAQLYNAANRTVAILCNHKRSVGAAHETQMQKLADKLKGLHYQIWRHKKQILDLDATQKKKKGAAYFELPEDLDQEWIEEHQKALIEEQRTKIEKKFEKDNEKRKADKEKPLGNSELKERLKVLKEMETMYKKENKTNKVEAGPRDTVEGLHKKIEALEKRIENHKAQMEDREGNKEVALGTSKINYIDPRLTVVFAKKFDVPIEKFFSKTLRDKFRWAIKTVEDEDDWTF